MLIVYNVAIVILFILGLPYILAMLLLGRQEMGGRLGLASERRFGQLNGRRPIWLHAASVGEISAVAPLVSAIKRVRRDLPLIVSTTTVTGLQRAKRVMVNVNAFTILPLDFPFVVRRVLGVVKPQTLLLVESEFWPNLILEARRVGCSIGVVNGRISEEPFRRYRLISSLISGIFRQVGFFCVQSESDLKRFSLLGADPRKVVATGSMKFDAPVLTDRPYGPYGCVNSTPKTCLELGQNRRVIVAGSTREGEEKVLVEAYRRLCQDLDNLLLILAPRHLRRVGKVERLVLKAGFTVVRKSQIDSGQSRDADVIILDTMGELSWVYACADVAFVGGSLVPFGGHNPLEPAAWGIPVIFGPHMKQEGAKALLESGAAFQVKDCDEFVCVATQLLKDPLQREAVGAAGKRAVENRSGVAKTTVELLLKNGII